MCRNRLAHNANSTDRQSFPNFEVPPMHRTWFRVFVFTLLASPTTLFAAETLDAKQAKVDEKTKIAWYDIRQLGLEGQGWSDTKAPYDRLPAKAEGVVRDAVWNLSRQSAGICVRFRTDAPTIHARWTVVNKNLALPHMAATGVSGLDLYVRHEGRWRWLATGFPKVAPTNSAQLVATLEPAEREYRLYLPLYNSVSSVEIGIPSQNALAKGEPFPAGRDKPILFYGTSITHGASASRPGMVHTGILGRRFDRPVINLGFSGNGKMEPELASLLAELDPAVYVLDCLPNMSAAEVTERVEPFVRKLREAHPATPIVLVEDRTYADSFLIAAKRERNETSRAALKQAYERLLSAGVQGLSYVPGEPLLGDDGEGTVDSSHPTDLGFMRQADFLAKTLVPLLQ
jgi:hypothetical protein